MSNSQKPGAKKLVAGAVRIVTKAMGSTKAAKTLEITRRNQGNDKK